MIKRKYNFVKYFVNLLLLLFILQVLLPFLAIKSNYNFLSKNQIIEKNFQICNSQEDFTISQDIAIVDISNKDIYIFPEIENILCLGSVVGYSYDGSTKALNLNIGTNQKVFKFLLSINTFALLIIFFNKNKLHKNIPYLMLLLFYISNVFNLNYISATSIGTRFISGILVTFPLFLFWSLFNFKEKDQVSKFIYLLAIFGVTAISYINFDYISNNMRLNRDTLVWLSTAIRMDFFDIPEYKATWEHKGSIIFWVYSFIYKYIYQIIFKNIWSSIGLFFIFINTVSFVVSKKIIFEKVSKLNFLLAVPYLLYINITFTPNTYYYSFLGTRLIGSTLFLIGIYFLLNNRILISSIIFSLGVLVLPTFFINIVFLLPYFVIYKINIYKFFLGGLLSGVAYFFYLFITDQIFEFYFLTIKFNILLSGAGSYYPLTSIISNNILLFLNFLIATIFFSSLKKLYGKSFYLIYSWSIGSVAHLIITGPRWPHYDILIIFPFTLLSAFLLIEIRRMFKRLLDKNNNSKKYFILLTASAIYFFSLFINLEYFNFSLKNNTYQSQIAFMKTYDSYEFEKPKVALILVNDQDLDYIFNHYGYIPSTRTWPPLWHQRSTSWYKDIPFDELFSENYFEKIFYQDINYENPEYAFIDVSIEFTHKNYLYSIIKDNYIKLECEKSYCKYKRIDNA